MFGFTPVTREIKIPPDAPPPPMELVLLPLAEITRGLATQAAEPPPVTAAPAAQRNGSAPASNGANAPAAAGGRGAGPGPRGGFQRAAANPNAAPPPAAASAFPDNDDTGAATTTPRRRTADQRQRQQRRRLAVCAGARVRQQPPGGRGLYNGGIGLLTSNSALDSRPFSFNGQPAVKPDYNDVHFIANFGGPIRIPASHASRPELLRQLPARAEPRRHAAVGGDADGARALRRLFAVAQRLRPAGAADRSVHRARPFAGNVIPADRISPRRGAACLLPAAQCRPAAATTSRRRSW
jgi:hypothetical protein